MDRRVQADGRTQEDEGDEDADQDVRPSGVEHRHATGREQDAEVGDHIVARAFEGAAHVNFVCAETSLHCQCRLD